MATTYHFTIENPDDEKIQGCMPPGVDWTFTIESDGGRRFTTSRALTDDELNNLRDGIQDFALRYDPPA